MVGTNIALQVGVGLCFGGTLLFAFLPLIISILIGFWMYKDAEKRDKSGALWFIIGFFLSLIGLIIWLVVRPDMSEVRRKRQQQQQYQQGPPQQQQQQAKPCPDCGGQMRYVDQYDRWYCDNCGEYK